MSKRRPGVNYKKRVLDIAKIYDHYARLGLPNRLIWRNHIYPVYGISERSFYNILKASMGAKVKIAQEVQQFLYEDGKK